jgi:hypothetical protein
MGLDIVNTIGNKEQFKFTKTYDRTETGINRTSSYEDERECEKLFGTYGTSYGGYGGNTHSSTSTNTNTNNRSDGKVEKPIEDDAINEETVKYIIDTYDDYVNGIKVEVDKKCDVIEDIIKDKFREAGIDYSTFSVDIKKEFAEIFSKEIKF